MNLQPQDNRKEFNRVLEFKERLVQTYIIVVGLLLANSHLQSSHHIEVAFFVFLITAIDYCTKISGNIRYNKMITLKDYYNQDENVFRINLSAVLVSLSLSYILMMYLFKIENEVYPSLSDITNTKNIVLNLIFIFLFIILSSITINSLLIKPEERFQKD